MPASLLVSGSVHIIYYTMTCMNLFKAQGDEDETEKPKTSGIGLDDIHNEYATPESETIRSVSKGHKEQMMSIASNRALIQYFAKLGQSQEDEMLNLDFVDHLLKSGADINCCDKFGQTILHEVSVVVISGHIKWGVSHGFYLLKSVF